MNELDLIYGPNCSLVHTYGKEPLRELYSKFDELIQSSKLLDDTQLNIIKLKFFNVCRKLYMLHGAGVSAIKTENDFIVTQNRECPALIWEDEIKILYHLESMILFARSALDLGAYIFSNLMLQPYGTKRTDSFNDFGKILLKSNDEKLTLLKNMIMEMENNNLSWYRLLCGSVKGRALRDKVAHQTIITVDYFEVEGKGEKEYCHVVVDNIPIPLERFVANICVGVFDFFFLVEEIIIKNWTI